MNQDTRPTPQQERELAAMEAAADGRPVDAEFADLADLVTDLGRGRPGLDPGFAERLDRAVDDHFPAEWSVGRTGTDRANRLDRFRRRLAGTGRPRILPAAAGFAGVLLVAVVVAIGLDQGGSGPGSEQDGASDSASQSSIAGSTTDQSVPSETATDADTTEDAAASASREGALAEGFSSDGRSGRTSGSLPGPFAAGVDNRKVARTAQITLGTSPAELQNVSNEIVAAVDAHDGIVLGSSVRDGDGGIARASFRLMIPSARLDSAITDISGLADLKSRNESTTDITAPTLTVKDRLSTSRARIRSLENELAGTTTEEDRARVESELRAERRKASRLQTRLNGLNRRANLTPVQVSVQTGDEFEGGSTWGIPDALDDAGKLLAISAGVALIAMAIAIPIAIMVLISLAVNRAWARHSRNRALRSD